MSLRQALLYFLREAGVSLRRSWKVSLLAVFTIAVSLLMGGSFLLVTSNLERLLRGWQGEARVTVYLETATGDARRAEIAAALRAAPWVGGLREISGEQARVRFAEMFPSMGSLLEGWEDDPLPASLEVAFDPERVTEQAAFASWLEGLRAMDGVTMVDDDRDWLRQLGTIVAILRGVGLSLGGAMLVAAVLTIASVIRLTIFLYQEEIATLRLVGATEFFIRGPFYAQGMLQGSLGGLLAVAGLFGLHRALLSEAPSTSLGQGLVEHFLPGGYLLLLVALGGLAGLVGVIVSLRREDLGGSP